MVLARLPTFSQVWNHIIIHHLPHKRMKTMPLIEVHKAETTLRISEKWTCKAENCSLDKPFSNCIDNTLSFAIIVYLKSPNICWSWVLLKIKLIQDKLYKALIEISNVTWGTFHHIVLFVLQTKQTKNINQHVYEERYWHQHRSHEVFTNIGLSEHEVSQNLLVCHHVCHVYDYSLGVHHVQNKTLLRILIQWTIVQSHKTKT